MKQTKLLIIGGIVLLIVLYLYIPKKTSYQIGELRYSQNLNDNNGRCQSVSLLPGPDCCCGPQVTDEAYMEDGGPSWNYTLSENGCGIRLVFYGFMRWTGGTVHTSIGTTCGGDDIAAMEYTPDAGSSCPNTVIFDKVGLTPLQTYFITYSLDGLYVTAGGSEFKIYELINCQATYIQFIDYKDNYLNGGLFNLFVSTSNQWINS